MTLLVADASLRQLLSPEDKRNLKDAEAEGLAKVVDDADPLILELADEYNCTVLSNDNFVGHRRTHPWIDGSTDRFVQVRGERGAPRLEPFTAVARTDYSMSRAEERDELKDRHIDLKKSDHRDLLDYVYRCENPSCLRRSFVADESPVMPELQSGRLVCQSPSCRTELTRAGLASETIVFKLSPLDGGPGVRLPLELGSSIIVGRATDHLSLKELLSPERLKRLSRNHARLTATPQGLTVEDLNSTNGTTIARWRRERGATAPGIGLAARSAVIVKPRDRVELGNVIAVERSGRRFAFDLQPLPTDERSGRDAPRTHIASEEEF